MKKNNGELKLHDFFHDALLQKNAVIKIYYDSTPEYIREEYEGLNDIELGVLLDNPKVEPIEHETVEVVDYTGLAVRTHNLTVKIKKSSGKIVVENVPPEEIIVTKRAKSLDLDEAPFVAHRVKRTLSWLRNQGFNVPDDINDGDKDNNEYSDEKIVRDALDGTVSHLTEESPTDPSQREVTVTEAYLSVDLDGDGIAERIVVTKVGNKILKKEPIECMPFVSISPFPNPHKWNGRSLADLVMDLQLLKSMLMRAILDSFAFNINPAKGVDVTKILDVNDLLDANPGNWIRMKGDVNSAFYPLPTQGVGADAFNLMGYIDNMAESRTGVSKMTQGINENMFNKTATGTQAIMSASQEKLALIVRLFAKCGVAQIFKKIIKLASSYIKEPEIININGEFRQIDTRIFAGLEELSVNIGTGSLDKEKELINVNQLLQLQQSLGATQIPEIMAMVSPDKVHNAITKVVKALGYKNSGMFFNDPSSPEYMQTYQFIMSKQPQPQPDPNLELVKVEAQKAFFESQNKQQDLFLKQQEIDLKKLVEQDKSTLAHKKLQLESEIEMAKMNAEGFNKFISDIEAQLKAIDEELVPPEELPGQLGLLRKALNSDQTESQLQDVNNYINSLNAKMAEMQQYMNEVAKRAAAPKRVIRDERGMLVGVEPILED